MPRQRTLPDADVLHRLRVQENLTYQQIADRYGVTKAAVHLALRKSGLINKPRPRYEDEIPWQVAMVHKDDYKLHQLRLAARLRRGERIPEVNRRYVENWMAALSRPVRSDDPELDAPLGLVVHYDRVNGFQLVPRTEHDDWIICRPARETANA